MPSSCRSRPATTTSPSCSGVSPEVRRRGRVRPGRSRWCGAGGAAGRDHRDPGPSLLRFRRRARSGPRRPGSVPGPRSDAGPGPEGVVLRLARPGEAARPGHAAAPRPPGGAEPPRLLPRHLDGAGDRRGSPAPVRHPAPARLAGVDPGRGHPPPESVRAFLGPLRLQWRPVSVHGPPGGLDERVPGVRFQPHDDGVGLAVDSGQSGPRRDTGGGRPPSPVPLPDRTRRHSGETAMSLFDF